MKNKKLEEIIKKNYPSTVKIRYLDSFHVESQQKIIKQIYDRGYDARVLDCPILEKDGNYIQIVTGLYEGININL